MNDKGSAYYGIFELLIAAIVALVLIGIVISMFF